MTDFFNQTFYNNTIEQWAKALFTALIFIILARAGYWLFSKIVQKATERTKGKFDDIVVNALKQPVIAGITLWGFFVSYKFLHFSDAFDLTLKKGFFFIVALNVTWFIARLSDALIREYLIPLAEKTESDFDDQLMPIIQKGTRSVIWLMGIIIGLNNAGYDVNALIAGLGIGGLALAMAAKDTISNIFGGVMVFIDKPFKINERIKINGFDGTVVEIGLRCTRIKTLEGRIVTIPNNSFTGNAVENITLEPSRKVVLNLGLTYDTTPENIELAMQLLKQINEESKNTEENTVISFNTFGDFSLGILFVYYIKKESDIPTTQSEMSLAILKAFNTRKLEFAFPTQTIFHQQT